MALKNWTALSTYTSLVTSGQNYWTSSPTQVTSYYYAHSPRLTRKPIAVYINGAMSTEGTLGALIAGQWAWGDNDSLGYDTVYVRIAGDGDPDAQATDYAQAVEFEDVLTVTAGATAIIFAIEISNQGGANANVALVRKSASGTETYRADLAIDADDYIILDHKIVLEESEEMEMEADVSGVQLFVNGDES